MPKAPAKAAGAFRTIGEVAEEFGLQQHVLRYWETRFPQLRPLQRAGGRRYYRPDDVALVRRINTLLNHDGYTIKGVQQLLAREGGGARRSIVAKPQPSGPERSGPDLITRVRIIRDSLAVALADDE